MRKLSRAKVNNSIFSTKYIFSNAFLYCIIVWKKTWNFWLWNL